MAIKSFMRLTVLDRANAVREHPMYRRLTIAERSVVESTPLSKRMALIDRLWIADMQKDKLSNQERLDVR